MEIRAKVVFTSEDIKKALTEYYYNHRTLDEIRRVNNQEVKIEMAGLEAGDFPYLIIKKSLS